MGRPRTPDNVRLEFRSKLLELGVVTQAAKAAGIPNSTGYDIARELEEDAEFVTQRQELRARVLPELEARLSRLADSIVDRIEAADPTPQELAKIAVEHDLKSFSYQNPKPQYFRGLVDMYKAVGANRNGDEPGGRSDGPAVVINLTGTEPAPENAADG